MCQKKGFKHSEKTKNKMAIAHFGKRYINRKSNPMPEETKKKIGNALRGREKSKEHREKISEANRGKVLSEEHKRKISESEKGRAFSVETRKKLSASQKGDKGNNWRGGITPENKKVRKSIEFSLWREAVFARDNWTCQKYNIKGGKLHPHHIQNFSQYPELRFAIDNGVTLSEKAHKEFHKEYGMVNNTKEQLDKFLSTEK